MKLVRTPGDARAHFGAALARRAVHQFSQKCKNGSKYAKYNNIYAKHEEYLEYINVRKCAKYTKYAKYTISRQHNLSI